MTQEPGDRAGGAARGWHLVFRVVALMAGGVLTSAVTCLAIIMGVRGADWWSIPTVVFAPLSGGVAVAVVEMLGGWMTLGPREGLAKAGGGILLGMAVFGAGTSLLWYEPVSLEAWGVALAGIISSTLLLFLPRRPKVPRSPSPRQREVR